MKPKIRTTNTGFTLMEIIIVLALMVTIGAMAAPTFQGTLKQQRLRKAAETIRADWVRTRGTAMQNGETQVWTCITSSGQFSTNAAGNLSMSEAGDMVSADTGLSPTSGMSSDETFGKSLSNGISITDVMISEADTMISMSQFSTGADTGNAIVFFYPDGTCSSARITLQGETGEQLAIVLNGVAGTTRLVRVENQ